MTLEEKHFYTASITGGKSADAVYPMVVSIIYELKPSGGFVDFGAGRGNLVRRLSAIYPKLKFTAIDILSRPPELEAEVNWVQTNLNFTVPLPAGYADTLVSTEVIEHLENPRAVFREYYRLLRPGGTLVLTTPNQESLRSFAGLLFGGHFVSFLDSWYPAHITALLRKDFERLAEETGFSKPYFKFSNSGGIPKMPWLSWQRISLGALRGRLFSDNIAIVVKKPTN